MFGSLPFAIAPDGLIGRGDSRSGRCTVMWRFSQVPVYGPLPSRPRTCISRNCTRPCLAGKERPMSGPWQTQARISLLARLAQPGPVDQTAWREFVEHYGPMIFKWCRRWNLQEADARDVTQQVLLKLALKM